MSDEGAYAVMEPDEEAKVLAILTESGAVEAILARLRPRLEEALAGGWDESALGADVRVCVRRITWKVVLGADEWPRQTTGH